MTFTDKEKELLITGLQRLDYWDLGINPEYDWGDGVALDNKYNYPTSFPRMTKEEYEKERNIIKDALYSYADQKDAIIQPLIDKLSL